MISGVSKEQCSLEAFTKNSVLCGAQQGTLSKSGHIKCARERNKVMKGLKDEPTARTIIDGFRIYYNFVRPHQSLNGKTPAQVARMEAPNNWKSLIEEATKHEAELLTRATTQAQDKKAIEVLAK